MSVVKLNQHRILNEVRERVVSTLAALDGVDRAAVIEFLEDRWVTTLCLLPRHMPARPYEEDVAYVVRMAVDLFRRRRLAGQGC